MEYANYLGVPPIIYNEDDTYEKVTDLIRSIIDQYIPALEGRSSGYAYMYAHDFTVYFYNYEPLAGAEYIEIPRWVKNSKSCVNIKNDDDKCFLWCHLRHHHPSSNNNPNRISDFMPYENDLNISMLTFPVSDPRQIKKFDLANNTSILVLYIQDDLIKPYYVPKNDKGGPMDLGMVVNKENKVPFILINDLSRLLSCKFGLDRKTYYCRKCLYTTKYEHMIVSHQCYDGKGTIEFLSKTIKLPNKKGLHSVNTLTRTPIFSSNY